MKFKQIRFLMLSILSVFSFEIFAQDDVYKAEIGIMGGGSFYLGEANSLLFNNMQPDYGGFLRYIISPRFALRGELGITNIVAYKDATKRTYLFNNSLNTFDVCGEFNFFDLEDKPYKRLSKTFSPYIFTGFGGMTDLYVGQNIPEISWVFGAGMKVMLTKRLNLNVQWSNRLLLSILKVNGIYYSDYMEGIPTLNNPQGLNGNNIFNNDLLSTFTVGLSLDIWKKPCKCMDNNTANF